jgi:hypothetical protein
VLAHEDMQLEVGNQKWAWKLLQEALPHNGTLQKAAFLLERWKHDDMGARSLQQAVVKHQHAVPASTSSQSSALQLQDTPDESIRRDSVSNSAGKESPTHREAVGDVPKGDKVEPDQMGGGEGESTVQHSNETYFQYLHDTAASRFRTMAQMNEEIQTSIEDLASVCLDEVPLQPNAPASFGACNLGRGQKSASHLEDICCSEHDSNAVGEDVAHDNESMEEGVTRLKDRGREDTSTCSATNAAGLRTKAGKTGLLGESGQVIEEAHEALKELEDVHSSDGLMHFEFFGPFWELSEV